MGISEEELYNLPTAEYVYRRGGFIARPLTVYHVAFHALADLRNVEVPFYITIQLLFRVCFNICFIINELI